MQSLKKKYMVQIKRFTKRANRHTFGCFPVVYKHFIPQRLNFTTVYVSKKEVVEIPEPDHW